MAKKPSKPKMGRPLLPPGKRRGASMGFRPTPGIRGKLEEAAKANGRSMSQEVEHRLERSFEEDEARGGRKTNDVLKVMGSVAAQIQTRKGKTVADWQTGLTVGHAWKRLIHDWLPKPPAEWIAEASWLSDAMSDAPERPKEPIRGGLLVPRASEEEWEAYRKRLQKYQKNLETFLIEYDEHMAAFRKIQDEVKKALEIGEEALGLLSDQEK